MANETPPKRESLISNPQVLAAAIGGLVTIAVAIIGLVPALVNNAPTPQPTVVSVTATPETIPTQTAASQTSPTLTPLIAPDKSAVLNQLSSTLASSNILLLYDDVSFTLRNQSDQTVSFEGITFSSTAGGWEARDWGPSVYNNVPAGKCLRLRDATVAQRQPPTPCRDQIHGLQEIGTSALFWIGVENFDVLRDGQVIAVCRVADGSCPIGI
jgi:hypothetical protein